VLCFNILSWQSKGGKGGLMKFDEWSINFCQDTQQTLAKDAWFVPASSSLLFSLWIDQSQSLTPPLLQFLLLQPMLLLHVCHEKTAIASGLLQNWRRNMHQNSKLPCTSSWIAATSEPISDSFLQIWNLIFTIEELPRTALKSITSNHKQKCWQIGRVSCHPCDDLPK
jgi:hypothetical protein